MIQKNLKISELYLDLNRYIWYYIIMENKKFPFTFSLPSGLAAETPTPAEDARPFSTIDIRYHALIF